MGKKMKLLFSLINFSHASCYSSSLPWPSCSVEPRTHSFRTPVDVFKTMNSAYIDNSNIDTSESWLTNSSESSIFSTESEDQNSGADPVEKVIRGLGRSDRLFFKPGKTNSILEEAKKDNQSSLETMPFKESTIFLAMDSQDPQLDFRKSMVEMVEAHGFKNWKCLEELLFWYLRVNDRRNHEYIVGAFVDLFVGLSLDFCPNYHSHSSPSSFYTSSSSSLSTTCVSSSSIEAEDIEHEGIDLSSLLDVENMIIEVRNDAS